MAAFTLPDLPYDYNALEPHIDEETMRIHHDRHHAAYVNNVNAALEKHPEIQAGSIEELIRDLNRIPEDIRTAVRNNGGGHANHSLFWEIMSPNGGGEPGGRVGEAIRSAFGDFARFREELTKAGTTRFGSGWAWLVKDNGGVAVTSTLNQDSPLMEGKTPILGVDVWEHAYYLKYQNKRADYLGAWFNTINWDAVEKRFGAGGS